jgi:hypothetical protein
MRARFPSCPGALFLFTVMSAGTAGCRGGGANIQVDGSLADKADVGGLGRSDASMDVSDVLTPDVGPDEVDGPPGDANPDATASSDLEASADTGTDLKADAGGEIGSDVGGGSDAPHDVAAEKAPATATWTIDPNPMCTASGAGCMDLGALGGYQITASGTCPLASSVQLWFPGGSTPLPVGTYAVKPAAGILDVISMPAGMVGLVAERDAATDAAQVHQKFWGRGGSVTVAVSGGGRRVTFAGVSVREETTSAMTTLGADITCP